MDEATIIGERYWRMTGRHHEEDRFWKKRGLYRNFKYGLEISNSFGFALKVSDYEDRSLNIHFIWPSIYIKIGKASETPACEDFNSWGFNFWEDGIHVSWGRKTKILKWPWGLTHLRTEGLMQDATWEEEPGWRDNELRKAFEARQWRAENVPWFYRSRDCEKQEGTATITVDRRTWRGKLLPFRRKVSTSIDVEFNSEVGNQRGSWKGGTIGCSYELKPGESPLDCFRRMMRNRNFDRR